MTPKEGICEGIPYESNCELACLHWLLTLKKEGYVLQIERSPSFLLCDPVTNNYAQQLKRGSKAVQQVITKGHSYTPDFKVWFTDKAIGKFIWVDGTSEKWARNLMVAHKADGGWSAYIEVKPDFDRRGSTSKAVNDMKWVYQKYRIFVNLFRPEHVFNVTFTPQEYLKTSKGKVKKLRYKVRSLKQYLTLK